MSRHEKTEHTTKETRNGIASDTEVHVESSTSTERKEEIKGYGLVVGGILLFIYTLGALQFLNYIVAAGALVMIFFGAKKANLIERGQELIHRMKNKS